MKLGIHTSTRGWTDTARAVADALQAGCFLWMEQNRPADALAYPNAVHILRLPNPHVDESGGQWWSRVAGLVNTWVSAPIPAGALILQLGNEPDTAGYDLPVAWDIPAWKARHTDYLDYVRTAHPNIGVLCAPFTCANTKQITADYVDGYDGIATHNYWAKGNPGWRQGVDGGAAWLLATAYGKPVYVTELGCNPQDAGEILAWLGEAHDQPLLRGMCLFLPDAAVTEFAPYDVSIEMAAAIRAGTIPMPDPPPPSPEPTMQYTRDYDPRSYTPLDARWRAFIARSNPDEADAICAAYDGSCREIGYDANAAVAQGAVETAVFTSERWRNAHNAAGIGIYADSTPDVIWGDPPHGDVLTGIRAQCELLSDYFRGGREPWGILAAHGFGGMNLGKARLSDMDGVWAADRSYSLAIVGYLNRVLGGEAPAPSSGVTLEEIYRVAQGFVGRTVTEEGNPEFLWCEQVREEIEQDAGLPRTRYPDAATHGATLQAAGKMRQGIPPRGAGVIWSLAFEPRGGHIATAADYPLIITTYKGGQIAVIDAAANGWYGSPGFLGYYIPDGVSDSREDDTDMHVDGKWDAGRLARLWDGPKTKTAIKSVGGIDPNRAVDDRWITELKAGKPLGYATSKEEPMPTGGVIRYFSNGFVCWYPDGSTSVC